MVTEGDSTSSSSSGASAQSQSGSLRPIVMPESFAAGENEDWDSWISHFEDCAILNGWNNERKAQFLAVRMRGAALLQLQSLSSVVRGNYDDFKKALREKFVPQERIELHKAEFRVRRRERDEKLPDLAGSLRRLVKKAYPEAVESLQDSLAKDQFIDALEDREIRMKVRESGPKALDEAVSRALQLEAMLEAESRRSKGRQVRVVQEPSLEQNSDLVELLRQNRAAMEQMVQLVQRQETKGKGNASGSGEQQHNGRRLGPRVPMTKDRRERRCFQCHQKGHFIAECPQKPKEQSGNSA